MLAFRSLDPFRALGEPDRRRRDEERLSRSEQRTLSKTQNNHLTGKAPYKFESSFLHRRVICEPDGYRPNCRITTTSTASDSPDAAGTWPQLGHMNLSGCSTATPDRNPI